MFSAVSPLYPQSPLLTSPIGLGTANLLGTCGERSRKAIGVAFGDRHLDVQETLIGTEVLSLARSVGSEGQVIVTGFSRKFLTTYTNDAVCMEQFDPHHITPKTASIFDLGLPSESVTSCRLLGNISMIQCHEIAPCGDEEAFSRLAFLEASRVVSPGGRVVVAGPDWSSLRIVGEGREAKESLNAIKESAASSLLISHRRTDLRDMMAEAQLEKIAISSSEIRLSTLAELKRFINIETCVNDAVSKGLVSVADSNFWLLKLQKLDREHGFIASLQLNYVVGHKL